MRLYRRETPKARKELNEMEVVEDMTKLEMLAVFLSIQALLESGDYEKAKEIVARIVVAAEKS